MICNTNGSKEHCTLTHLKCIACGKIIHFGDTHFHKEWFHEV